MSLPFSRRKFLRSAGVAAGFGGLALPAFAASRSPNEKLHIAVIGVGGMRGGAHLDAVARENVVALCDVDARILAAAAGRFPKAKTFADFRRLLDRMHRQIDAVVISTPDHTHAPAGMMAMRLGKHCYCEKPLAHSVYEARQMAIVARDKKLATQLGTQIHAGANYRRAVELVQSGAIGQVAEVHVWLGANFNGPATPTNMSQPDVPKDTPPVPPALDLGPLAGTGCLPALPSDICTGQLAQLVGLRQRHARRFLLPFLRPGFLGAGAPPSYERGSHGTSTPGKRRPLDDRQTRIPGAGSVPPVTLNWYNGGAYPAWLKQRNVPLWQSGVLFVGTSGMLLADYGRRELLPRAKFAGFKPPHPTIPDSIGHHEEWLVACRTGSPTTCNFSYGDALTEAALLCNVALRIGKKLIWNAESLTAADCPEAQQYIHPTYRKGWLL